MAHDTLTQDETSTLIASNKVEGTAVYNRHGERLGTVDNVMVDKKSGKVAYAVMRSGGLFGMGGELCPLPWAALDYETDQGGYIVDRELSELENAPRYSKDNEPNFNSAYGREVYGYYGMTYPFG